MKCRHGIEGGPNGGCGSCVPPGDSYFTQERLLENAIKRMIRERAELAGEIELCERELARMKKQKEAAANRSDHDESDSVLSHLGRSD